MTTSAPQLLPYRLFASALAGRSVELTLHRERHQRAFTDGRLIAVPETHPLEDAVCAIAVQACLIAEGALDGAIMRTLRGHRRWTERYLSIEAVRCVHARAQLVPDALLALPAFRDAAVTSAGPHESLRAASSTRTVASLPACFGLLVPERVLREQRQAERAQRLASAATAKPQPPAQPGEKEESKVLNALRSPVQSSLGLVSSLVDLIFQRQAAGAPATAAAGLDGFSRQSAAPFHVPADALRVRGPRTSPIEPVFDQAAGLCYPEWDQACGRYRPHFAHVAEVEPLTTEAPRTDAPALRSTPRRLRRHLQRLSLELEHERHQQDGEWLVLDDLVRLWSDLRAGHAGDARIYAGSARTRRDLGVLLLLDISGSSADPGPEGRSVFQSQLALARSLAQALHESGDRVAVYGFHSWGRTIVRMQRVKAFDETLDTRVWARFSRLTPVGYSRLGAAIRHSATLLQTRARTSKRLLVLISDAFAYDRDYEGSYARADTRRALLELRAAGAACVCVSVGASEATTLAETFGESRQLRLDSLERCARPLVNLFQAALGDLSARRQ